MLSEYERPIAFSIDTASVPCEARLVRHDGVVVERVALSRPDVAFQIWPVETGRYQVQICDPDAPAEIKPELGLANIMAGESIEFPGGLARPA